MRTSVALRSRSSSSTVSRTALGAVARSGGNGVRIEIGASVTDMASAPLQVFVEEAGGDRGRNDGPGAEDDRGIPARAARRICGEEIGPDRAHGSEATGGKHGHAEQRRDEAALRARN